MRSYRAVNIPASGSGSPKTAKSYAIPQNFPCRSSSSYTRQRPSRVSIPSGGRKIRAFFSSKVSVFWGCFSPFCALSESSAGCSGSGDSVHPISFAAVRNSLPRPTCPLVAISHFSTSARHISFPLSDSRVAKRLCIRVRLSTIICDNSGVSIVPSFTIVEMSSGTISVAGGSPPSRSTAFATSTSGVAKGIDFFFDVTRSPSSKNSGSTAPSSRYRTAPHSGPPLKSPHTINRIFSSGSFSCSFLDSVIAALTPSLICRTRRPPSFPACKWQFRQNQCLSSSDIELSPSFFSSPSLSFRENAVSNVLSL
mmetsp:Transcript_18304/g.28259  ORF Transcript_18304/g.28259 Transcript_18304/m.28259 type:complete len:310 (+) Transcript_18304:1067-1996(+)